MATPTVSEEQRAAREQMVFACVEIAQVLRGLAKRLEERPAKETSMLAYHARRLAALTDRLELEALSDRPMNDANLRATGRVLNDLAIQLGEAVELAEFGASTVAVQSMGQKFARAGDLIGQAFLLCDVRLS